MAKIHPSAQIEYGVSLGSEVVVWANTHVREEVKIGDNTIIGEFCYIGPKTVIGKNCKIQNGVYIYEPSEIEDGVFIGPRVIITNDKNPRAVTSQGEIKTSSDWNPMGSTIGTGASIGAGVILVSPIKIGPWAMIAAGSVVTKDVPNFALYAGNPAKHLGWVGKNGFRLLQEAPNLFRCPNTNTFYELQENQLRELNS